MAQENGSNSKTTKELDDSKAVKDGVLSSEDKLVQKLMDKKKVTKEEKAA